MTQVAVGVDVGGSGIKVAAVDVSTGQLVGPRLRVATPQPSSPDVVVPVIIRTVRRALREAGLIEVDRQEVVQSRLRRYYKLTGLGARRLAEETVRLRRNVTVAGQRLRKLGLSGGAA